MEERADAVVGMLHVLGVGLRRQVGRAVVGERPRRSRRCSGVVRHM
ncbi:MAG TPA: hypothetical protein VG455_14120 [Acidimicrobiales bacterium]|nr:hypothetical protein [Acidimicrobiales bacterium]